MLVEPLEESPLVEEAKEKAAWMGLTLCLDEDAKFDFDMSNMQELA